MDVTLSNSEFYILLSLAIKSRHGYEIMQQVDNDSRGKVRLGPGTLYGSIKRMLESQLIQESPNSNSRRKYYTLTEKGKAALSAELDRYNDTVQLAKRENIFNNTRLIKLSI